MSHVWEGGGERKRVDLAGSSDYRIASGVWWGQEKKEKGIHWENCCLFIIIVGIMVCLGGGDHEPQMLSAQICPCLPLDLSAQAFPWEVFEWWQSRKETLESLAVKSTVSFKGWSFKALRLIVDIISLKTHYVRSQLMQLHFIWSLFVNLRIFSH